MVGGRVIVMKIRLFYTEIPFWRAEVSRLALYIGNIDFEDVRMTWREDSMIPFRIIINDR